MMLEFKPAKRESIPLLISVAGVSGSGKTFSALLLAAGLAGEDGKVGGIDTENRRMSLYCDSPTIKKALPRGFSILHLDPPFSPARYVEAIQAAEAAGITVLVLDSLSHEWEGTGGACDIAEKQKRGNMLNWAAAKLAHKRFMNCILSTKMHIVFCVRAREKVKIVEVKGKTEVVPLGLTEITEKSAIFEMTIALMLEETTHLAIPRKVPEPLAHLFPGGKLVSKEDGERIREWNSGGAAPNPSEQLQRRARLAADDGMEAYKKFFGGLPKAQQKVLADTTHEDNKALALAADADRKAAEASDSQALNENQVQNPPTPETIKLIENHRAILGDKFQPTLEWMNFATVEEINSEDNARVVLAEMQKLAIKKG
jgi:hypothetical protein